jgi:hypothetical protein
MTLGTMFFSALRHNLAHVSLAGGAALRDVGRRAAIALLLMGGAQLVGCERTGPGLEPPLASDGVNNDRGVPTANAGSAGSSAQGSNATGGSPQPAAGGASSVGPEPMTPSEGASDSGCGPGGMDAGLPPDADAGIADCDDDAGM